MKPNQKLYSLAVSCSSAESSWAAERTVKTTLPENNELSNNGKYTEFVIYWLFFEQIGLFVPKCFWNTANPMSAGPHILKKETKSTEIKKFWIQFGKLGKFKALIFKMSLAMMSLID